MGEGGGRESDRKWEIVYLGKRNESLPVDGRANQNRKQSSKKALSGDLISHCADSSLAVSALFNKQY